MDDSARDAAVAALRELVLAVEASRAAAADRLGLNITDAQAISYLLARGALGQTELAAALRLTTGSVTQLVDRLESRGLVARTQHPTDRRRSIVTLSASYSSELDVVRAWLPAALDQVPPEGLAQATSLLSTLAESLRAQTHAEEEKPDAAQRVGGGGTAPSSL